MKILFPTDYSKNACNAFSYACHLSKKLNAELVILHVYQLPLVSTNSDFISDTSSKIKEGQVQQIRDFIDEFKIRSSSLPIEEITIELAAIEGEIIEEITKFSEDNEVDYIVMGTKGATNSQDTVVGTITSNVIKTAKVPVFAIPQTVEYKDFKNIVLSEDFEQHDMGAIKMIKELSDQFNAHVYLLHINEAKDMYDHNRQHNYPMIKFFTRYYENFSFSFTDHDLNKFACIENFIETKKIDLVCMIVRPKEISGHNFEQSLINYVALDAKIPLLTFPKEMQQSLDDLIVLKRPKNFID